jgi:3-dehydroquinate synthase
MAADLSFRLGMCALDDAKRIKALVTDAGLPCSPPASMDDATFLSLMRRDKKVDETGLRFVLVNGGIGGAALVERVPIEKLRATLRARENLCSGI